MTGNGQWTASRQRKRPRRTGRAWVTAASLALVAFTAFVLLDTFAIARVQATAQEADFSSIAAARDSAVQGGEAGAEDAGTGNAEAGDAGAEEANGDGSAADRDGGEAASGSQGESGHRHGGGHGGSAPGGHGPGSGQGDAQGSEADASVDRSVITAGAASAASVGTQIGSYADENMSISVYSVRAYDTDIYVADVQVSSAEYLKTALAQDSFGRNLKDTTSNMAEDAGAVLAVNGDYYGFRDDGYVLRNGVLYRDAASSGTDALVIYGDGTMAAASEDATDAQSLADGGAWQVLSFGPVLVSDGQLAVDADDEVSQSMGSNPRTAIGMVDPLHYIVVVSDGRTDESAGLSLYQLAQVMADNGATFAYNLDGGGSTTMWFQGEVVNSPTSGNRDGERQVSDIVYFG